MGKKEQNTKTNPLIGHLNVRKLKLRQSHTGAEKNINTYKKPHRSKIHYVVRDGPAM